ncbi:MAG TPA: VWA domain-containing protein [Thermoanaerobaculia bacterium]|nr:VWA domain-containing protein [Thermoanaerobaculia bacterium]
MIRSKRATPLALAALLLAPLAAPAQQEPPAGEVREQVEVTEVLLDVLVTDARGNVILGLDESDFVVTEDGKPIELTDVVFYSNRRLLDPAPAASGRRPEVSEGTEDRYFVLFLDDQRTAALEAPRLLTQQMEAVRRARQWVAEELVPGDHVAVVSYDHKLKVHQDFTTDRAALDAGLAAAAKGKDPGGNWPSRIAGEPGASLRAGLPRGNELRDETTTIYDALQLLARAAGDIRGRKNLLYFGVGFGRLNSFGQYTPDPRYYDDTVRALNDHNVAFYAVDLTPPGTEHALSDALNQISGETGGKYYFNTTNFLTPLRQVSEENSGYYLLSYTATHPAGADGFQKVKVAARNPEFRVRAREGYVFGQS